MKAITNKTLILSLITIFISIILIDSVSAVSWRDRVDIKTRDTNYFEGTNLNDLFNAKSQIYKKFQ